MQFVTIALTLATAHVVLSYDEKFDKVDIDKILSDDTLLMSYINCILDKGPCSEEYSADYKEMLPEVLSDGCAKCTKIQLGKFRQFLKVLVENKPDIVLELKKKINPTGQYDENIKKILENDS